MDESAKSIVNREDNIIVNNVNIKQSLRELRPVIMSPTKETTIKLQQNNLTDLEKNVFGESKSTIQNSPGDIRLPTKLNSSGNSLKLPKAQDWLTAVATTMAGENPENFHENQTTITPSNSPVNHKRDVSNDSTTNSTKNNNPTSTEEIIISPTTGKPKFILKSMSLAAWLGEPNGDVADKNESSKIYMTNLYI